MSERFRTGELVRHKTGGPKMAVDGYNELGVICSWYDGRSHQQKVFVEDVLEQFKDEPASSAPTIGKQPISQKFSPLLGEH